MNKASIDIYMQIFCGHKFSTHWGKEYNKSMCSFIRNFQTVFISDYCFAFLPVQAFDVDCVWVLAI